MSKKVIKRILFPILIAFVLLGSFAILFFVSSYNSIDLDINKLTNTNSGVKVYALNDLEDNSYSYNSNRKIVDISQLHDYTVNAFIDIEDKRFYSHNGYDLKRILKSMLVNIKSNSKKQGASTITQQLIKNTMLSNEKTYKRKFNEIVLAIKTEKAFDKKEILNMYLNTIYFGSNAYGIENASETFFNKSAKDLTINESAILAGIIKSPKHFSPKTNKSACFKRKNLVLKQMYKNGHISKKEYNNNINKEIEIDITNNNYENSYYQQTILEACKILNISEKELIRDNYQIVSYLDLKLQENLAKILSQHNYDCDKLTIVANNKGEILAYLGDSFYDLSNIKRSPASTLKPLAVYLPAIENDLIFSSTPIKDEKINFSGYSPRNVNDEYNGWVSAKYALAHSLNIPAIKTMEYLTPEKSYEFLTKLGLELDPKDKNLSLALGGLTNGIEPIKLLQSYSIFQDYGKVTEYTFIDKILDKNNRIVYQNSHKKKNITTPESAYLVTDMLKESVKTGNCKQLNSFNFDIASKTGTNFVDGKTLDLYNIAFTPEVSVLTWLGDVTNVGLTDLSSSFNATKINKEILNYLSSKIQFTNFLRPENVVELEIDTLEYDINNKLVLATENTLDRYRKKELFKSTFTPLSTSDLYQDPNLDFDLTLTDFGAKISFLAKSTFSYKIVKKYNNTEIHLLEINEKNDNIEYIDEKIFSYDKLEYKLVATNNYTMKEYTSSTQTIYPKDYLMSKLNNSNIFYDSKKRWYV